MEGKRLDIEAYSKFQLCTLHYPSGVWNPAVKLWQCWGHFHRI